MARVLVAMSGGVDSSVGAWLLKQQRHEVIGLLMRHGQQTQTCPSEVSGDPAALATPQKQGCCTAADAADARRVADALGIAFYVADFEEEFARIVDYFVAEYTAARTPNPCIVCNNWLKFGKLFDYADALGAEFVATGHHARLVPAPQTEQRDQLPALCRGRDPAKDQSYVLFGIQRRHLGRLRLPVGEYRKEDIRRMADEVGLRVADKPDSQEICFVPGQDYAAFVRRHRAGVDTSGEIVTTDGEVVGRHDGLERFTIGQRKGLGIAFGEPRYVVRLEADTRRVVVGTRRQLARTELTASGANWLVDPPAEPFRAAVKIRYRSRAVPATITPLGKDRFRVEFDEPRHGVAPGQAAVCYDADRVLGGAWIE